MNSKLACALALLCIAPSCLAAPPERRFNRTAYLTELGLLGSSQAADVVSTRQAAQRLPQDYEQNPVYGRHPGTARQVGLNAAFFALEATGLWLTEHSKHKSVRWLGRVWAVGATVREGQLAACNAHLSSNSRGGCL